MLKNLHKFSLMLVLAAMASMAHAEEDASIAVDLNSGRGGEARRIPDPSEFKVCADQDNLPFSNAKLEGFENKIAELIANDLGKKLSYQFWYDRFGFLRNTLNAGRCDVIIGTNTGNDALLTSKPYYRSGHVFIWRKESGFNITDWDSPDLRKGVIGVVDKAPVARPLFDKDLMANARPYRLMRDLNLPPSFIVDDLAKGDIDIAILWGPIAGYYAKKSTVPMVVVPAPEYGDIDKSGQLGYNISVGVRKKETERLAEIQGVLDRRQADILKILDEYGIPHVPVVQPTKGKKKDARGDAIPKNE